MASAVQDGRAGAVGEEEATALVIVGAGCEVQRHFAPAVALRQQGVDCVVTAVLRGVDERLERLERGAPVMATARAAA